MTMLANHLLVLKQHLDQIVKDSLRKQPTFRDTTTGFPAK